MASKMPLEKLALKLIGPIVDPYIGYFDSLKENMRRASMKIPIRNYVSAVFLYSLLAFMFSLIISSFFVTLIVVSMGSSAIFSYTSAILISFISTAAVVVLGYYYPGIKAKGMQSKIDRSLPFAVFHMATTASSGVDPVDIFKMLSVKGGVIGNEAERIYRDVNTMGMNLQDAIQKSAQRTPSSSFADLLWGMSSVIATGGSMQEYLNGKTRTFMSQYRRALEDYSRQISLYTEIYITLIIVGTLFFIVLMSIISPIAGGSSLIIQTFLVFFLIPAVSIGFIILLKGISPVE